MPDNFDRYGRLGQPKPGFDRYGNPLPGTDAGGNSILPDFNMPQNNPTDSWSSYFGNSPFTQAPSFQQIIQQAGGTPQTNAPALQAIKNYTDTFRQMFSNETGQEPTSADYDKFFSDIVIPAAPGSLGFSGGMPNVPEQQLIQGTSGLLSSLYSGQIQNKSQQDAINASKQVAAALQPAVAGSQATSADILKGITSQLPGLLKAYQDAGSQVAGGISRQIPGITDQAIGSSNQILKGLTSMQPEIQTYLKNLLTQLMPDLLTSANAGGWANTGGLNEAIADASSRGATGLVGPAISGALGIPGSVTPGLYSAYGNALNIPASAIAESLGPVGSALGLPGQTIGPNLASAYGLPNRAADVNINQGGTPWFLGQGNQGLQNLYGLQASAADAYNRAFQNNYWGSQFNTNPSPLQQIGGLMAGGAAGGFGRGLGSGAWGGLSSLYGGGAAAAGGGTASELLPLLADAGAAA